MSGKDESVYLDLKDYMVTPFMRLMKDSYEVAANEVRMQAGLLGEPITEDEVNSRAWTKTLTDFQGPVISGYCNHFGIAASETNLYRILRYSTDSNPGWIDLEAEVNTPPPAPQIVITLPAPEHNCEMPGCTCAYNFMDRQLRDTLYKLITDIRKAKYTQAGVYDLDGNGTLIIPNK